VPQICRPGLKDQNRSRTILAIYADLDEIQANDFRHANIKSAESVAGADYKAVGYAGIRCLKGNVTNDIKLMPAPFRIEFAQGGFANAPSQNVPGADMSMHVFNLTPPVLRLPASVILIIASDGAYKVVFMLRRT
jgi:hypothetical protein